MLKDLFVSRRRLPFARRLKILRKAKIIAENWHAIPSEDDLRCELQLDQKQWEKYRAKWFK